MRPSTVLGALQAACDEADYTSRSYSGRGMYGAKCLGVECDNVIEATVRIVLALTDIFNIKGQDMDLYSHCCAALERGLTDSMGRGIILYFPNVQMDETHNIDMESDDDE